MAEKTLNTRIQLKFDTLANWSNVGTTGKGGNLVLKKGEVAICEIPSGGTAVAGDDTRPEYMLKVGDGTTAFKDLKWIHALAADVYDWAKAATKPTYSADEVTGLGAAAKKGVATSISTSTNLPTAGAVKTYVDNAVGGLSGAMHFKGKFDTLPAVTSYNAGDVVIVGNKEYVLNDQNGTKTWVELGDESIYVEKRTGYDLSKNDFTDALKNKLDGIATGATKVEASTANGKIKINGTDTTVYTLPSDVVKRSSAGVTPGNLVSTDAAGDIMDAGVAPSDLAKDADLTALATRVNTLEGKPGLTKVGTVTSVSAASNSGFKITGTASVNPTIDWDSNVTLVLNGGTSTTVV